MLESQFHIPANTLYRLRGEGGSFNFVPRGWRYLPIHAMMRYWYLLIDTHWILMALPASISRRGESSRRWYASILFWCRCRPQYDILVIHFAIRRECYYTAYASNTSRHMLPAVPMLYTATLQRQKARAGRHADALRTQHGKWHAMTFRVARDIYIILIKAGHDAMPHWKVARWDDLAWYLWLDRRGATPLSLPKIQEHRLAWATLAGYHGCANDIYKIRKRLIWLHLIDNAIFYYISAASASPGA